MPDFSLDILNSSNHSQTEDASLSGSAEGESSEGIDASKATLDVEQAVRDRYSEAAQQRTESLCCPVDYDASYLKVLPDELIERDYGCGDPSKYVRSGETVLDLGSGGGKICYIASQVVGKAGRVLGVDMNDEMLALARTYQKEISQRIGHDNVTFFKGRIQDLALDLDQFKKYLAENPVRSSEDWIRAEAEGQRLRQTEPMIASESIDVVVSNCVLNLVEQDARRQLFSEIFRVLRRGGRAVISDIVSDEIVPEKLQNDSELWSGCISGAFLELDFLRAFEEAGFYGLRIVARQEKPWAVIEGIEFRSMTIEAYKGKEGPCNDRHQAVIYQGPWRSVTDDDGHVLHRGVRSAVCGKTFAIYTQSPYAEQITPVEPYSPIAEGEAEPFNCRKNLVRDPRQTKGESYQKTDLSQSNCCGPEGDCC